jgi:hypothetical protein
MIAIAFKWPHMVKIIFNKVCNFDFDLMAFLVHLIKITP